MRLRNWEDLPQFMRNEEVYPYYVSLKKHSMALCFKRLFDIVFSLLLLIVLSPIFLVLAIWIKADSKGPVFYRQERITQYGKVFRIYKFRTMCSDADQIGSLVTSKNDSRITNVGKKIRKCRLDEIPQLLNVLVGDMSFVGTRPEVKKYVDAYKNDMYSTLLLPAGVTSKASIEYRDEDKILGEGEDIDTVYINKVLPGKMKYNLQMIDEFSIITELKIMWKTVF